MKFSDLKFIRLTQPEQFALIPRRLFEQVAEKDPDVIIENLYKFGPMQLTCDTTFLYVMVDGESKIKGVLWAGVNDFSEILEVSFLSVDREYQNSDACKVSLEFLQQIQKKHGLRKIRMMTKRGKNYKDKYERVYKKQGMKESDIVIMEI